VVIGDVAYYDYFEEYPPLDGRSGILWIPKESSILGNSDNIEQLYYAYMEFRNVYNTHTAQSH
jgi:hypothetical protein